MPEKKGKIIKNKKKVDKKKEIKNEQDDTIIETPSLPKKRGRVPKPKPPKPEKVYIKDLRKLELLALREKYNNDKNRINRTSKKQLIQEQNEKSKQGNNIDVPENIKEPILAEKERTILEQLLEAARQPII